MTVDPSQWNDTVCGVPPGSFNSSSYFRLGNNTELVPYSLWPNETWITYTFRNGLKSHQDKVRNIISEIRGYANITWVYIPWGHDFEEAKADLPSNGLVNDASAAEKLQKVFPPVVRIDLNSHPTSWSAVGLECKNVPKDQATTNINLSYEDETSNYDRSIVLHQLGHILGLRHEHNPLFALKEDVAVPVYKYLRGWSEEYIKAHVVDLYNYRLSNSNSSDNLSIMTFYMPKELNVSDQVLDRRPEFSDVDKALLRLFYPPVFAEDHPELLDSYKAAMTVLSIPEEKQTRAIASFKEFATDGVRSIFFEDSPPGPLGTLAQRPAPNSAKWNLVCGVPPLEEYVIRQAQEGNMQVAQSNGSSAMWPNNTIIHYTFMGGKPGQRMKVNRIIEELKNLTDLSVQFRYVPPEEVAFLATVRIAFDSYSTFWSAVGTECDQIPWDEPTMNLNVTSSNPPSKEERANILHQLGHALGLRHDHFGQHVEMQETNAVELYGELRGWSEDYVKSHIVVPYNNKLSNSPSYDENSIMTNYMPNDLTTSNRTIPLPLELSEVDRALLRCSYPKIEQVNVDIGAFRDALNTVRMASSWQEEFITALTTDISGALSRNIYFSYLSELRNLGSNLLTLHLPPATLAMLPAVSRDGLPPPGPLVFPPPFNSRPTSPNPNPRPRSPGLGNGSPGFLTDEDRTFIATFCATLNAPIGQSTIMLANGDTAPAPERPRAPLDVTLLPLKGEITISFDSRLDFETNARQIKVRDTVTRSQWLLSTGVSFVFVDTFVNGQIRIAFDNTIPSRCEAIGKQASTLSPGAPTMYLNIGAIEVTSALERWSIVHQFGHALGLGHEHEPYNKGGIRLNETALIKYYARQGYPEDVVRRDVLRILEEDHLRNGVEYDPKSIMNYIIPLDVFDFNGNQLNAEVSALDHAFMGLAFPPTDKGQEPTLIKNMTAVGFSTWVQDSILGYIKADPQGYIARRVILETIADLRALSLSGKLPPRDVPKPVIPIPGSPRGPKDTPLSPGTVKPSVDLPKTPVTKPDPDPIVPPKRDPVKPARGAAAVSRREPSTKPFLATLIEKLKEFFNPGGGQIFVLQFPGRFLQESEYAWDTKSAGIYGHFVKPTVVNEAEFRLVDQMYDVAEVVAAPNGTNLSIVYEQMLNNLLPKYQDGGLARQQAKIRAWLLRDAKVSSWMLQIIKAQATRQTSSDATRPAETRRDDKASQPAFAISNKAGPLDSVNRMELSNALMQEYLEAKKTWELERDTMIEQSLQFKVGSEESARELNNLTRKLAHITAIREAQLASKYADAVVQGFYHNVKQYLGYLDIKSTSEFLQDAKDAFREAAMSSMDGALRVYPVQMSPIDWFEGLSTSFTVEDLTSNPELIASAINAKSRELDVLNGQLAQLTIGTKGNAQELEKSVTAAQDELDRASSDLAQKYSGNVIAMAKTCIDAYGNVQEDQLDDRMDTLGLADELLTSLKAGLENITGAQRKLTSASRALSDLLARHALAEATDTRQQQEQIKIRISSITRQIQELNARYTVLNKTPAGPKAKSTEKSSIADVELFPKSNNTSGGSRWQEITMYQKVTSSKSKSSGGSSAQASQWNVNLWLGSASGGSSSATGFAATESKDTEETIELGFRATLVTVDRGGWFQPQFFKQSKGYYHINDDLKWTEYPSGVNTPEQLKKSNNISTVNNGLLPAYPVGYIICKDITIKIERSVQSSATDSETMSNQASASGGILCFSYSGSSSESSDSKSFSFESHSDGYVIRIPGPQILGYVLQLTEKDETSDLPAMLPDNFFVTDEEFNAANDGGKSHGIDGKKGSKATLVTQMVDLLKSMGVSEAGIESVLERLKEDLATVADGD